MAEAYCELYVEDAQDVIPESFSFATYYLKLSLEEYVEKFLAFEYIHLIEEGNPHYLSGMSGIELAAEIVNIVPEKRHYDYIPYGRDYWIGWIVAYYQWSRNVTYKTIFSKFSLERFIIAYPTFHEKEEEKMYEYMDEIIFGETNE